VCQTHITLLVQNSASKIIMPGINALVLGWRWQTWR